MTVKKRRVRPLVSLPSHNFYLQMHIHLMLFVHQIPQRVMQTNKRVQITQKNLKI